METSLIKKIKFLHFIFLFLYASIAIATGKGPVGLWQLSERFVIVADKSLPGLILVDLLDGRTVEQLMINDFNPVGVTTCLSCKYILMTGNKGDIRIIKLMKNIKDLIDENSLLYLSKAKIEKIELRYLGKKIKANRIIAMDKNGDNAYFTSSSDNKVFKINLLMTPGGFSNVSSIFSSNKHPPLGINFDKNENLLITMRLNEVLRLTKTGEVLETYNLAETDCPSSSRVFLRAAVDDPYSNDSIFVLVTNPQSYDGAIWKITKHKNDKILCSTFSGKTDRSPGWTDSRGKKIFFSRPHYFTLNKDLSTLIVTDIDNRAIRIIDIKSQESNSVIYKENSSDSKYLTKYKKSKLNCDQLSWVNAKKILNSHNNTVCVNETNIQSFDNFKDAKKHCLDQGARLCEASEISYFSPRNNLKIWTNTECASCWIKKSKDKCGSNIYNFKTPFLSHKHKLFKQSWNTSQLVETVHIDKSQKIYSCVDRKKNQKASTICCADQ